MKSKKMRNETTTVATGVYADARPPKPGARDTM